MDDTRVLRDVFIREAADILASLESDLVRLEDEKAPELVNDIFRYVHTLKGSSGIAGFKSVYAFTHRLENLLDMVRSGKLAAGREIIDLLLVGLDWIRLAIDSGEEAPGLDEGREGLLKRVEAIIESTAPIPAEAPGGDADPSEEEMDLGYRYFRIKAGFREDIFETGTDPLMIMEDLFSLGVVVERHTDRKRLPELSAMDPEKCYLGWNLVLKTKSPLQKIDEVFMFVRGDNPISVEDITAQYAISTEDPEIKEKRIGEILVAKGILTDVELNDALKTQDGENTRIGDLVVAKGYATEREVQFALGEQEKIRKRIETSTVRVDTGKLDKLLNLLGEIVIGQSAIAGIAEELDEERGFMLKNALYGLDRTTREFQEQIMSIRMIPIGPSFEQFRRFVRDTAHAHGKEIRLEIDGGETELDKTVIERIDDPLKHMIRNAIDHGIEPASEREAAGKDRNGTITLRSYHQEGNVYIDVVDDGRGIDKVKLRARAEQAGLLKPGEEASEAKLLSFLFLPGVSTAEEVGDLSGRGVGMDVVKNNIESLRGSVEITTRPGKGSTFRIKLPLTLAIIEGMLVRVGRNVYIVPLLSIVESLQPRKEDIRTVKEKGEVIQVRGEYVSLVRLYDLFGIEPEFRNPWESLVVIVEAAGSRVGMMIDELLGQQQIVIKSLENHITKSRAVSGAAILGDGRVALIIDIHGLIEEISR
ncbi:MAG: chemotaxis protein CheA [Spirochaetota bacterium]|nr:chemotaxis protein CheA [Spirochaetota bacterium]HPV99145.1 chemotaxis protein CheA [Spirochaetota bacterium]